MSEKYGKISKYLNYVEHFPILVSIVTGCVSISAFVSLVCVPFGIMSSAVGIKINKSQLLLLLLSLLLILLLLSSLLLLLTLLLLFHIRKYLSHIKK